MGRPASGCVAWTEGRLCSACLDRQIDGKNRSATGHHTVPDATLNAARNARPYRHRVIFYTAIPRHSLFVISPLALVKISHARENMHKTGSALPNGYHRLIFELQNVSTFETPPNVPSTGKTLFSRLDFCSAQNASRCSFSFLTTSKPYQSTRPVSEFESINVRTSVSLCRYSSGSIIIHTCVLP